MTSSELANDSSAGRALKLYRKGDMGLNPIQV